ncbi:hypothetical protein ISN39_32505 (plasmid) [Rhizobium sp. 007]|nr:hypothetical protein ISN39_32505 [Rhizobium sp. 007]
MTLSLGPSHHATDLKRFFPDLSIISFASHAPTNHGHLIQLFVTCTHPVSAAAVRDALATSPRVVLLTGALGSTADVRNLAGSGSRNDAYAVVVWAESVVTQGHEIALTAAVHMEAIVVPETIDAIRAIAGREWSAKDSRYATDCALQVRSGHIEISGGGEPC